ncbi:MAG: hypothetical protein AB7O62_11725 [Pirellulales bacterium]
MRIKVAIHSPRWRPAAGMACLAAVMLAGCFNSSPPAPPPAAAPVAVQPAAVEPPETEEAADDSSASPTADEPSATEYAAPPALSAAQLDESSERLLILSPTGPLLVRVLILLDGQPWRRELSQDVDRLLAAADTDGDGTPLWPEAAASEAFDAGPFAESPDNAADRRALIRSCDLNRDGIVDRLELRRLLTRGQRSDPEFSLDSVPTSQDNDPRRSPLWPLVDADDDQAITAADAGLAAASLKLRDTDDDDLLYPDELGLSAGMDAMGQPQQMPNAARYDESDTQRVRRLGDHTNWSLLRYTLKELYAYEGSSVEEAPFFSHLGTQLDTDADGRISAAEVEGLARAAPHIDLELRLNSADDEPSGVWLRGEVAAGVWGLVAAQAAEGLVALEGNGLRLRFDVRDLSKSQNHQAVVDAQLAALDANKDGYLEKSEMPDEAAGGEQFDAADADGDGKLYPQEMLAYARQQAVPGARRIRASTAAAGDPLFTWLDASHDGRLSPREWTQAAARLLLLDANQDNRCDPAEIPLGISLTFTRGGADNTSGGNPAVALPVALPAPSGTPAIGPVWFVQMDSNGDGDISPREFLGNNSQFQQLDTNQDGFITPQEAMP